jgi:hypothetical protein
MKICFILLVVFFILLYFISKKERFSNSLVSPTITSAEIVNNNGIIKWDNKVGNAKEFFVLYIDAEFPDDGMWVIRKVLCNKDSCELTIPNMNRNLYRFVILSSNGDNVSKVRNIIKFGQNQKYSIIQVKEEEQMEAVEGTSVNGISVNGISVNGISGINGTNEDIPVIGTPPPKIEENESEPPVYDPIIICDKAIKYKDINNLDDQDNAEIKYNCPEDKELNFLEQKYSRNLLNEFKLGNVGLDFKLSRN